METTLYTSKGKPVAYISEENDNAIYLWDGHAVAYLYEDKIYGWKGKHLGWFIDNVIYDLRGNRVGYTRETCPNMVYAEYAKNMKYVKYVKYAKFAAYARPALSYRESHQELTSFLAQNRV